jgi:hypothetical protein
VVKARLFGHLWRRAADLVSGPGEALHLPEADGGTLQQVLARVGVALAEVGNVFLNGRLLPRATYPITLGYPRVSETPLTPEEMLGTVVRSGGRVGVFPRNMSAVIV